MTKKSVLLFFSLCVPSFASAVEINEFKNKFLTARAYVDIPSYTIDIQSKVSSNHVVWKPNIRDLTGVDVSINGFIGAGIGWANNDDPGSAQKKGVTDYSDYRIGANFIKGLHLEANYQTYTGFYIENTPQIDPTVAADTFLQDRSMTGKNISLNLTFVPSSDRFSYEAALGQDVRQEASGGSWLWGLAASDTLFSTGNNLIPVRVRSTFGEDQNIKRAEFYSLSIKGGYGYTVVMATKWFLTFVLNAGLGAEYRSYGDDTKTNQSSGATSKADALFAFGFNGDDFLMAVIAMGDLTTYTTQSLQIPSTIGDAKVVIGAHF